MKFKIKHEIKGRIRVRAIMKHMTAKEADLLEYALSNKEGITSVRVNEPVSYTHLRAHET